MPTNYYYTSPISVTQDRYNVLVARGKPWIASPTAPNLLLDKDDLAAAASVGSDSALWAAGDQICVPNASALASTTATQTSGTPLLVGGPGMVVPGGTEVQGITFMSSAAATALTNHFAFLAIPDESGRNHATVVAVSNNLGSAAWGANTAKKFSFRVADGGSGYWKPSVDTPVYGGIVQAGTTPATLRGITNSGQVVSTLTPKWSASSAGGITAPYTMATILQLNDAAIVPHCRLSSVYN